MKKALVLTWLALALAVQLAAKAWLVKNEGFLGAAVGLVRKACGIDPTS